MTIKYYLRETQKTNGQKTFIATVITSGTLNQKELIEHMRRKGSTVSVADMMAVMESLAEICDSALLDGFRIKISRLCHLAPTIQGTFDSLTDLFDPSRHKLHVIAQADIKTTKSLQNNGKTQKIEKKPNAPSIIQYYDYDTKEIDSTITPEKYGIIRGYKLNMTPSNPDEGIVITDNATRQHYPVSEVDFIRPGEITIKVPALPEEVNNVSISITSRPQKTLKNARSSVPFGNLDVRHT